VSIFLSEGVWVTVQEMEGPRAPQPFPLVSGFSKGMQYRVLGIHSASETSEAYFILCNDRDEVWFISNRHFRVAHGPTYRRPAVEGLAIPVEIEDFSLR